MIGIVSVVWMVCGIIAVLYCYTGNRIGGEDLTVPDIVVVVMVLLIGGPVFFGMLLFAALRDRIRPLIKERHTPCRDFEVPGTDAGGEEYRRAPDLDNYANLSPKELRQLVKSLGKEPTLESAVYRAYRRGFIKGHLLMNVLHGTKIQCETCDALGRYDDSTGDGLFFEDSVWFNKYTGLWECHGCWDK